MKKKQKGVFLYEFISQKCRRLKIVKTHIIRSIVHTVRPTHKLK